MRWFSVSEVRRCTGNVAGAAQAVPVLGPELSASGQRHGRNDLSRLAGRVGQVVSGDLSHYPEQGVDLRAHAFAPARRQLRHRLDHETQARPGHARAQRHQEAGGSDRTR